jgi:hypothetical protein
MDASSPQHDHHEAWVSRNRWRIGIAFAALVGGGYFWHRVDSRRRIAVDRVSQQWLAQREFEAGQHPDE